MKHFIVIRMAYGTLPVALEVYGALREKLARQSEWAVVPGELCKYAEVQPEPSRTAPMKPSWPRAAAGAYE